MPDVFRDYLIKSNELFPALADELLERSGVDFEYEEGQGLLYTMHNESDCEIVDHVIAGLPPTIPVEIFLPRQIAQLEPNLSKNLVGGALLRGEHQVNPMLLSEAFRRSAIEPGAEVRLNCEVTALRRRGDRIEGVELGDKFVAANMVINAAGSWAARLAKTAGLQIPVEPVRGQIVLTEALSASA